MVQFHSENTNFRRFFACGGLLWLLLKKLFGKVPISTSKTVEIFSPAGGFTGRQLWGIYTRYNRLLSHVPSRNFFLNPRLALFYKSHIKNFTPAFYNKCLKRWPL